MKLATLFLDIFILLLGAVYVCHSSVQDGERPLSLVNVLRSKRFDFTMFGCSDCRPIMECHTDSYCRYKKGSQYTCEFKCCSLRCINRGSDGHRAVSASHFYRNDEADDDNYETGSAENKQDFTKNETEIEDKGPQSGTHFVSTSQQISTEGAHAGTTVVSRDLGITTQNSQAGNYLLTTLLDMSTSTVATTRKQNVDGETDESDDG